MRSIDIRVRGRVQGVFFRASTKNEAVELGVRGSVRNEADGAVFIEAEAENETLEVFLDWVRVGPKEAEVREVEIEEHPPRGLHGFAIRS